VWLNGALLGALNGTAGCIPNLWNRLKREGRFTQGYSSRAWGGRGVKASGDTHDHGFALDIVTGARRGHQALSQADVRDLIHALQRSGFAAAFRIVGYNMGTASNPNINKTEHVHAAYLNQSNYHALVASTGPGGSAELDKMLLRRA
jgi:hypothetical protein